MAREQETVVFPTPPFPPTKIHFRDGLSNRPLRVPSPAGGHPSSSPSLILFCLPFSLSCCLSRTSLRGRTHWWRPYHRTLADMVPLSWSLHTFTPQEKCACVCVCSSFLVLLSVPPCVSCEHTWLMLLERERKRECVFVCPLPHGKCCCS